MTLVIEQAVGCENEREYILHTVFSDFLGLTYRTTKGSPGCTTLRLDGDESISLAMPDLFFAAAATDWLGVSTQPREPLAIWNPAREWFKARLLKQPLPVLFGEPEQKDSVPGDRTSLEIDILGSIFFMLTRYEETFSEMQDDYGGFPATASLAWRNGFLHRPLVNEYVELLWNAMHALWPGLERTSPCYRFLPGHDIDVPLATAGRSSGQVVLETAGDLLKRHDAATAVARLGSWARTLKGSVGGDLYNTFDFLMNTAEQHGITTAFFLYAGDGAHPLDPDYRLDDVFIENLCQRISERGHEIAAHPGYDRYCNATATVRDVSRLREMVQRTTGISEIRGSRQHYLRWSPEASWRNLAAAGLQYDATLGFNDRLGFRCGTCWEFPVYDLYRRQPIQLRERPLLFMDVTLLRHQAMGIAEIVDAANALADTCRRYGGDFTLLWHNNFLTTAALRDGYRSIVANAVVGT